MSMALAEAAMLKEIMENISHPSILHIEKVRTMKHSYTFPATVTVKG